MRRRDDKAGGANSTRKWMTRDYLREAIQALAESDGWIVTVAVILLTVLIIAFGFVGLVIAMWAYGVVAVK